MNEDIKILMATMSKIELGGAFRKHAHPYYQLNHVASGEFSCQSGKQSFTAREGDCLLFPANVPHSIVNTGGRTGYYFEVKFSVLSKRDADILADIDVHFPGETFSGALMREIYNENNNRTVLSDETMLTYLKAIILKLSAERRRQRYTPSRYVEVRAYSAPVRGVIRYLEENYTRQLTLDEVCGALSLKKSAICSQFRKETTQTIFACLMIIRVRKAVELLTYTELPLSEICRETGFINITHFTRVFSRHVMIPPGQFRKHLQLQDNYWRDALTGKNANPITIGALENRKIDVADIAVLSS